MRTVVQEWIGVVVRAVLLALFFTVLSASGSSAQEPIVIEANTEWMVFHRVKSVHVQVNDEVKDGCWKTPSSAKTSAELEFIRSGYRVEESASTFVLLSAVGYKHAGSLCVVSYDLSLSIPGSDQRYADQHRIIGTSRYSTLYTASGVLSGPAYDMSDRLREKFAEAVQSTLVQGARKVQEITKTLEAHENKAEAAFWIKWMNTPQ